MRHHWTVRWNLRYILDSTIHTPADKDTDLIWFLVLMNSIWLRAKWWTDLLPGEAFGAGEGKVGMRGLIHDESGEWDRVFDRAQPRYGAASSFGSIHDTGFHLNPPIFIQGGSTARIEKGICFQFPYLFYTHTKIQDINNITRTLQSSTQARQPIPTWKVQRQSITENTETEKERWFPCLEEQFHLIPAACLPRN